MNQELEKIALKEFKKAQSSKKGISLDEFLNTFKEILQENELAYVKQYIVNNYSKNLIIK